ncbi:MAG: hypothetical protein QNL04_00550 [SAR324 cluster bacterium]|nr:hypothetical protein [SAR324 cluster bacterium]
MPQNIIKELNAGILVSELEEKFELPLGDLLQHYNSERLDHKETLEVASISLEQALAGKHQEIDIIGFSDKKVMFDFNMKDIEVNEHDKHFAFVGKESNFAIEKSCFAQAMSINPVKSLNPNIQKSIYLLDSSGNLKFIIGYWLAEDAKA